MFFFVLLVGQEVLTISGTHDFMYMLYKKKMSVLGFAALVDDFGVVFSGVCTSLWWTAVN